MIKRWRLDQSEITDLVKALKNLNVMTKGHNILWTGVHPIHGRVLAGWMAQQGEGFATCQVAEA